MDSVQKKLEEKKPVRGILKTSKVSHQSLERPRFDEMNIKETHPHEYEQSDKFIPGTIPGPSNSEMDEELARRLTFLYKRKLINNEYYAAKLERLVKDEESGDDEEIKKFFCPSSNEDEDAKASQHPIREPKTPPPSKSNSPAESPSVPFAELTINPIAAPPLEEEEGEEIKESMDILETDPSHLSS